MMEEEMKLEKEKRIKKEHQRQVKRDKRKRQKDRKREKKEKEGKKKRKSRRSSSSSSSSSSSDSEPDVKKAKGDPELRAAIKKATREREAGKAMKQMDDRDRSYHTNYETKSLTPAELEAYNLTRIHSSDPMASHFSNNGFLPIFDFLFMLSSILKLDAKLSRILLMRDALVSPTIRFGFLLIEWAAHGIPWLIVSGFGTLYVIRKQYPLRLQWKWCVLLFGILLDLAAVGIFKISFQRNRPPYNEDDQVYEAPIADKFSFPSGHSSRAVMLTVLG
uniref:Phosphatidic acid phosphatase type 2/haloperoxidase domain-containing protein n=1 Tax=Panagrolaimus superbus TaxID=310955 RepID=A0A914Y5X1_9BILA